jgi:hypothetical protein
MPFIGNQPAESYASFETETFTVSATANYTLSHAVTNENEIRLVINGVVQQPGSGKAYTASGTTLTLSSATVSGDVMYAVYLGRALQTVNPPNASVGLSQLSATGTKDATTFLRGDNTFASAGGDMTPAFFGYLSADQTITDNVWTKVEINTEEFDTNSDYDNSTNYRFTPTTSGKYFFYASSCLRSGTNSTLKSGRLAFYKNGSALYGGKSELSTNYGVSQQVTLTASFEMNGSSDYVELYGLVDNQGGSSKFESDYGGTNRSTFFGGYKLIT